MCFLLLFFVLFCVTYPIFAISEMAKLEVSVPSKFIVQSS